jgi:sugar lactone lactonase YvrE
MKITLQIVLMAALTSSMLSQSFGVTVSPSSQTLTAGDTATIFVTVTATGGFNSSVFLSVDGPCVAYFESQYVNPPYGTQTVLLKSIGLDTGNKTIHVRGSNLGDFSDATVNLHVIKNPLWKDMPHAKSICDLSPFSLDESGNFVAMTQEGQTPVLYKYSGMSWSNTKFTNIKSEGEDFPNCAYDNNGKLWFGGSHGLSMYNGGSLTQLTSTNTNLPSDKVYWCDINRAGLPVARVNGGIVLFNGIATFDVLTSFPAENNPPSMYKIVVDSLNAIWGVNQYKVFRVDSNGLRYPSNMQLPNPIDMTVGTDGAVWILNADENGGKELVRLLNGTVRSFAVPISNSGRLTALATDSRGYVWVASTEGLFQYYQGMWRVFNSKNSAVTDDQLARVVVDGQGNVWLATRMKLFVYNPDGLAGIPLSVSEVPLEERRAVRENAYPNPAIGKVTIHNMESEVRELSIYNSSGTMVLRDSIGGHELKEVNITELCPGVYYGIVGKNTVQFIVLDR